MIAISFASSAYQVQQLRWFKTCEKAGLSPVTFNEHHLSEEEKKGYFGDRGYGFWFWKPLIIKKALEMDEEILYTDVDYAILNPAKLKIMLDESKTGIVLFTYPFQNRVWTRRDCFFYMNCDEERYWNTPHLEAGVSIWRRNNYTLELLDEWSRYCTDRRILSDDQNVCGLPNFPEFRDHRHDQSILTNLKEKHGIEPRPISSLRDLIAGADI
jgi:hypothetical protein